MAKKASQAALKGSGHSTSGTRRRAKPVGSNKGSMNDIGRTLEAILDAIPDVIGIQDRNHRIIRYNAAGYQFLNMKPEEVEGKKCFELIGQDAPCEICATAEVYRTKRTARREKYVESLGMWLDVRSYPILDDKGEIIRIVEHLRDVTKEKHAVEELRALNETLDERVEARTAKLGEVNEKLEGEIAQRAKAELTLREEKEKYFTMMHAMDDPVYITTHDYRIDFMNPALVERLGREGIGESCFELIYGLGERCPWCQLEKVLGGERAVTEVLNPRDGRHYHVVCSPLRRVDGSRASMCIARDLTSIKETETKLRQTEARLETIAATANDGIVMTDGCGKITYWNEAATKLFGYSRQEALNTDLHLLLAPERYQKASRKGLKEFRDTGKGSAIGKTIELEATRKDGTEIPIELSLSAVRIGDEWYATGIIRDIHQRKLLEETIKENEARLVALFNNMNSGAIIYQTADQGRTFTIKDINAAGAAISKVTKKEVVGRNALDVFPGIEKIGLLDVLRQVWRDGTRRDFPATLYSDGRISQWTENHVYRLPSGEVVAIYEDVTERVLAEESLAASEQKFRTVYESSQDAIMILGLEQGFLGGNAAAVSMFGCRDEGEFISYHPADLSPEYQADGALSAEKAEEGMRKALQDGSHRFEWIHKQVDGTEFLATVLLTKMKLNGQDVLQATVRDITEQKRAQEALKENEERFRTLFEKSRDALLITTGDGRHVDANQAALDLFGYSREELLALSSRDRYADPEERIRVRDLIDRSGSVRDYEVKYRKKDGAVMDCVSTSTVRRADDGSVVEYQTIVRDITEQKRADKALKESEAFNFALFEHNPIETIVVDQEGRVLELNRALRESDRVPPKVGDVMYKDYAARHTIDMYAELGTCIASNTAKSFASLPYGDRRLNIHLSPFFGGAIITSQDVTQEKQAEETLRKSEERFRLIIEKNADGIVIVDAAGSISFVNKTAEALFGRGSVDLVGTPFGFPLVSGETTEISVFNKDRGIVPAEMRVVQIKMGEGISYLASLRDVTERKRSQEDLKETLERLRKALTSTVEAMALTVETRDPYTAGHQRRVAGLACAIAKEMDLSDDMIEGIEMAGTIHDLGKIAVPAEILSKPGRITDIEFSLIKTHCQVGYNILMNIAFPWPVADIVIQHHERVDGTGYPSGIEDEEILLEAKIIGVADVVEAMATHRPYRPALGIDVALDEITQKKGRFFQPDVVDACVRLFRERGFELEG